MFSFFVQQIRIVIVSPKKSTSCLTFPTFKFIERNENGKRGSLRAAAREVL